MTTFTNIDGIFAPSCTSQEFQLKVGFTIETKTKMQKLLRFFKNFRKNFLYSKILVVKYKFCVKTLFIQEMQKCPKNSIKVTIEKAINCGMACLFTLLHIIFWLEKLVIHDFSSYLGLKVSIRHKK